MDDGYIRKADAIDAATQDSTENRTHSFRAGQARSASRIKALEPADVTHVVHCRDCAKLNRNGYCTRFQNNICGVATSWFMPDDDDFCSYGKHSEE